MKKRLFSLLTALALCLSLLPATALAATNVQYLDANGTTQTCASATEVTSGDRTWGDDGNDGWYVAPAKTMSIGGPNDESPVSVTVTGNVHLILVDNCNLTIYGGIRASPAAV